MNYWNKNLKEILQPGNTVKIFFNEGNRCNKTIEIKEIVDKNYIVYRIYDIGEESYYYKIEFVYYFKMLEKDNCLSIINRED
jgi:hypothetical protein